MRRALKRARLKKKKTVQEMADAVGVQVSTYYKWEQGTRDPLHEHMKKVSGILEENIDTLFFNHDLDCESKDQQCATAEPDPAA